jgi:hypothetical protein
MVMRWSERSASCSDRNVVVECSACMFYPPLMLVDSALLLSVGQVGAALRSFCLVLLISGDAFGPRVAQAALLAM